MCFKQFTEADFSYITATESCCCALKNILPPQSKEENFGVGVDLQLIEEKDAFLKQPHSIIINCEAGKAIKEVYLQFVLQCVK